MTKKSAAKKAVTAKTTKAVGAKQSPTAPTTKKATTKAPTTKATPTKAAPLAGAADVSKQIEQRFRDLGGWRGDLLAKMRSMVLEADPDIVEERKWVKPSNPHGVPTYSHSGLVLTLEVYKDHVKATFAYGSKVSDPTNVFNASLLGLRRAVDVSEGGSLDAAAFKALVRGAVAFNVAKKG